MKQAGRFWQPYSDQLLVEYVPGWTHRAAVQSVQDIVVSVEGAQVTRMYALDMWRGR